MPTSVHPSRPSTARRLRADTVASTLFAPVSLQSAIDRLGFVQADPIRSPARAQDLILRHRVRNYRAGDLERRYPSLRVDEDLLYAYGFVSRELRGLLHPRASAEREPAAIERAVLDMVQRRGTVHPRDLDEHFGRERVVNDWGGYSQATKTALERLHQRGLLRVAGRENGVRLYQAAPPALDDLGPEERFRRLVLAVAKLLAPVSEAALHGIAAGLRRPFAVAPSHRAVIRGLVREGLLERTAADGIAYLAPVGPRRRAPVPRTVRFLAPFDPLVRDRERFEHLWGWTYRFEAYTPPARRVRGYYAMPLLWGDSVIGWANAAVTGSTLDIHLGFVDGGPPADPAFRTGADAEIARLEAFLGLSAARGGGASTEPGEGAA